MRTLLLILSAICAALFSPPMTRAAVFTCDEAGLDAALNAARRDVNPDPGPHTFSCTEPTVIPVTSNKIVNADITLDGDGLVTLDGVSGAHWITTDFSQQELLELNVIGLGFEIYDSQLTLRRVHLSGFNGSDFAPSAAVYLAGRTTAGATLNLIESTIEDNNTCAVWGPLGGPGSAPTEVVIDRSTISGNLGRLGEACGGVSAFSVKISNSTISGNTYLDGGRCELGSGVNAAALQISNSTIVGNGPTDDLSYGFHHMVRFPRPCRTCPPPDPAFVCVTTAGEPVIVENSIIGSCVNHAGVVAPSGGGNLESPGDTCLFTQPTDQINVSTAQLNLDVLADNGGPTQTHELLPGSSAIDKANNASCLPTDQRGELRATDGDGDGVLQCDIGAFEVEGPRIFGVVVGVDAPASLLLLDLDGDLAAIAIFNELSALPNWAPASLGNPQAPLTFSSTSPGSLADISSALAGMQVRSHDIIVFYYTGHAGTQPGSGDEAPVSKKVLVGGAVSTVVSAEDEAICLDQGLSGCNAAPGGPSYPTDDDIIALFGDPAAGGVLPSDVWQDVTKVFILDTCYSGGFEGSSSNPSEVGDLDKVEPYYLISASSEGNFAYVDTNNFGFLTNCILDGNLISSQISLQQLAGKIQTCEGLANEEWSGSSLAVITNPGDTAPFDFDPFTSASSEIDVDRPVFPLPATPTPGADCLCEVQNINPNQVVLQNVRTGGKGSDATRKMVVTAQAVDAPGATCDPGEFSAPTPINLKMEDDSGNILIDSAKTVVCEGGTDEFGAPLTINVKRNVFFQGPLNCENGAAPPPKPDFSLGTITSTGSAPGTADYVEGIRIKCFE